MADIKPVLNEKGEWVIPATKRPDGTMRKERVIKQGYVPQEEIKAYATAASLQRAAKPGIPGLPPTMAAASSTAKKSTAPKKDSSHSKATSSAKATKDPVKGLEEALSSVSIATAIEKADTTEETDGENKEKKAKAIKKKLRQIEDIEDKVRQGHSITAEQTEKLSKKSELEEELKRLAAS